MFPHEAFKFPFTVNYVFFFVCVVFPCSFFRLGKTLFNKWLEFHSVQCISHASIHCTESKMCDASLIMERLKVLILTFSGNGNQLILTVFVACYKKKIFSIAWVAVGFYTLHELYINLTILLRKKYIDI